MEASYSAKSIMCLTGPPWNSITTWKSTRCTRSNGASACQVRPGSMGPTCIPTPQTLRLVGKGKVLIPPPSWVVLFVMSLSRRLGPALAVPLSPKADTGAPSPAKVILLGLNASEQQTGSYRGLLEDEHADT